MALPARSGPSVAALCRAKGILILDRFESEHLPERFDELVWDRAVDTRSQGG